MITKIHIYILQTYIIINRKDMKRSLIKKKIFCLRYIKIVNKLFLLIAVYLKICSEFNSDLSLWFFNLAYFWAILVSTPFICLPNLLHTQRKICTFMKNIYPLYTLFYFHLLLVKLFIAYLLLTGWLKISFVVSLKSVQVKWTSKLPQ